MNKKWKLCAVVINSLLAFTLLAAFAPSASAAVSYNQNITAILGNGNPNGGWTVDTANGIQLGLRAKGRNDSAYAGMTPNDGAGTYSFPVFGGARGPFNYEYSINSDVVGGANPLSAYDFYLAADGDASDCISLGVVNPLTHWFDNSYGNNTTANSAGVEPSDPATYLSLPTTNNVAQNSQNVTFGDYPGGAFAQPGPSNATYRFEVFAVATGAGPGGARLASVGITVVVGSGGAFCPPVLTCTGFQPPMNKDVSIKKKSNRVLPFKMQIVDEDGVVQTDADIAAPVIQVVFNSEIFGGVGGDDLLSSGKGDEGNQFVYDSATQTWQFNLNSKQFTAAGTYVVTAVSGDSDAYLLNGCEAIFIIE